MEEELKLAGKAEHELNWLAQDRADWKRFVGALCSSGREQV